MSFTQLPTKYKIFYFRHEVHSYMFYYAILYISYIIYFIYIKINIYYIVIMILFIHSIQVLITLSCRPMVLTAVNADVGGHFNLVIGLLVFRRRRPTKHSIREEQIIKKIV